MGSFACTDLIAGGGAYMESQSTGESPRPTVQERPVRGNGAVDLVQSGAAQMKRLRPRRQEGYDTTKVPGLDMPVYVVEDEASSTIRR